MFNIGILIHVSKFAFIRDSGKPLVSFPNTINELSREQEDIIKTIDLPHARVSAKTGDGVEELFLEFIKAIVDRGIEKHQVGDMEDVDLNSLKKESSEKKSCC